MLKKILLSILIVIVVAVGLVFGMFYKTDLTKEQLSEYINEESEFITLTNGADVHYRDEGNEDGPVLLMFHGGFGSLQNWEGWIPYLKKDYRLVSLDFPAHGLTGKIPEDVYNRKTMTETANLLMEKLGIDKFSIAGNSMGGGLALKYTFDHPEKVQSLILIGSEGIPNSEGGYDASMFTDEKPILPTDPGYNQLSKTEIFTSKFIGPSVIKSTLDNLIADKSLLTEEFVDYFGKVIRYEGNREANILMFRQWLDPNADPRHLEPRLKEITVPALYMHGAEDSVVPENVARRFVELLPNSELIIYENVGHMAMIERPKETALDLIEFLGKNKIK